MDWKRYERDLGDALSRLARESFPDNPDVTWRPLGYEHLDRHSYIEADATPAEVGYPRFKFVIERVDDIEDTDSSPNVVGCYVWDNENWVLLFGEDSGDLHPGMTPRQEVNPVGAESGCALLLFVLPAAIMLFRMMAL